MTVPGRRIGRNPRRYWPWLLAAVLPVVGMAWWAGGGRDDPRRVLADVLGTRDLPASVENVECNSYGFTDVLVTCAFTVQPADFPRLLEGWEFRGWPCRGMDSWSVTSGGPRVGPRFPVHACHRAKPAGFEHGGSVLVAADPARSRVIADLYVE